MGEKIIGCVCDPLTQQLQTTANSLPSQDGAVFLINNLHQLRTTLSLYRTPESRLSSLSSMIDSSLGILSTHQTNHLLSALGLMNIQPLFQAFQADLTVGWQLLISFSCLLRGSSYHQAIEDMLPRSPISSWQLFIPSCMQLSK